ncbi:MAG: hypothetical protein HY619_00810 [Thaumarchaeota archaeon]|nr:hypothetical protein [Nitrososphaerota archaeon]
MAPNGRQCESLPTRITIMRQSATQLRDEIITTVVHDFDYYRAHPQHLAWAMMNFELVHRVGRIMFDDCHDNPKDGVMDAQLPTESDANLLYDAWAVTVSNYDEFPDTNPQLPLEGLHPKNRLDREFWKK